MTIKTPQHGTARSPRSANVGFCLRLNKKKGTVPFLLFSPVVATLLLLPACGSQVSFRNENDKLRKERLTLKQEIDGLQEQLALREGELLAMRRQMDEAAGPIDGVEPPRLAGIVLGMYSGPIDLDGDKKYDALRVYVRPIDQDSRQITAAGSARVRLLVVPAEGEPRAVLDQAYDPDAFHTAYRSGVTGTHYTLGADLPDDPPAQATLHVTFTDAKTGRSYSAEKKLTLIRGAQAVE